MIELTNENFQDIIKEGKVLVDFYAVWCGPCRMMHPVIERIASTHPEVKVIKVNVDEHEDISRNYGIMSIPTIIFFENGILKQKNIGFISQDAIEEWLQN